MRKTLIYSGATLLSVGFASLMLENIFYGGIDENGVLQESLFLPLSFLFGFAGLAALILAPFQRKG